MSSSQLCAPILSTLVYTKRNYYSLQSKTSNYISFSLRKMLLQREKPQNECSKRAILQVHMFGEMVQWYRQKKRTVIYFTHSVLFQGSFFYHLRVVKHIPNLGNWKHGLVLKWTSLVALNTARDNTCRTATSWKLLRVFLYSLPCQINMNYFLNKLISLHEIGTHENPLGFGAYSRMRHVTIP